MQSPLSLMQLTRALADDSPNPVHKIAATLRGKDAQGLPFILSRTNMWPEILDVIPRTMLIGESTGWIHAETAVFLNSVSTRGGDLYITDPPCPDCMKNIITAGIHAVYVDVAGYAKPYAVRDGHTIIEMSHIMAYHAGIPVYKVNCQTGQITCLNDLRDDLQPAEIDQNTKLGPIVTPGEERRFPAHVLDLQDRWPGQNFATARAVTASGHIVFLTVTPAIIAGYTVDPTTIIEGKHNYVQTALCRLLLTAKCMGLRLVLDSVTCSDSPSSRDLVNFVGAGGRQIRILHPQKSRDAFAIAALDLLESKEILRVQRG